MQRMSILIARRYRVAIVLPAALMIFSVLTSAAKAQHNHSAQALVDAKASTDTFLYASAGDRNRGERYLEQFRINAEGKISPLSPSYITPSSTPDSLTCDPAGKFLYTAEGADKIVAYRIQHNGTLAPLKTTRVTTGFPSNDVTDMAFGPDGRFLYVTLGSFTNEGFHHGRVIVFRQTASGALIKIEKAGVQNLEDPLSIVFTPRGNLAYVIEYGEWLNAYAGHLSAYLVLPDGSLHPNPAQKPIFYVHIHKALISSDGRKLYASSRNYLDQYGIMSNGSLQKSNTGAGTAAFLITKDGSMILGSGTVLETDMPLPIIKIFKINVNGKIDAPVDYWLREDNLLQREPITETSAIKPSFVYELHITKNGKFIFKEFVGPRSGDEGIAVYRLDEAKGALLLVSTIIVPHEIHEINAMTSTASIRSH